MAEILHELDEKPTDKTTTSDDRSGPTGAAGRGSVKGGGKDGRPKQRKVGPPYEFQDFHSYNDGYNRYNKGRQWSSWDDGYY